MSTGYYKERYTNRQMQDAYENACDCLYYGMSIQKWDNCGLGKSLALQVWEQAFDDMASDF